MEQREKASMPVKHQKTKITKAHVGLLFEWFDLPVFYNLMISLSPPPPPPPLAPSLYDKVRVYLNDCGCLIAVCA